MIPHWLEAFFVKTVTNSKEVHWSLYKYGPYSIELHASPETGLYHGYEVEANETTWSQHFSWIDWDGEGLTRDQILCKIEQETLVKRPVDPACDLDEGLTVLDVLPSLWLPKEVKAYIIERQQFGFKKYGKALRIGWTKANAYRKEEEGDWLAYAILAERWWLVTLVGWIFWFNWKWENR